MKKAAIHVDWVISIGIFLIYISTILIYLKPGYTPLYTEEGLISIVQSNLEKDVYWTIKKVPIFIEECYCAAGIGQTCNIRITISDESRDWESGTNIFVYDRDIYTTITEWSSFYPKKEDPELIHLTYDVTGHNPDRNCIVSIGNPENLMGINQNYLNNLENLEYDKLKENWNYPKEKEFAIYIVPRNTAITEATTPITNSPKPFQEASIYVRQWNDYYVSSIGELTPITINIRVW